MGSTRIPESDLCIVIVNEEDYKDIITKLINIPIEDGSEYYSKGNSKRTPFMGYPSLWCGCSIVRS
jgi:hypothetical protein